MKPLHLTLLQRKRLRLWLAVAVFTVAVVLLLFAASPLGTIQQEIRLPPVSLPTLTPVSALLLWVG
jgi:hypothetical protein